MLCQEHVFSPPASGSTPAGPRPGAAVAPASGRLDPRHVPCARLAGGILLALLVLAGALGLGAAAAFSAARPALLVVGAGVLALAAVLLGLAVWFQPALALARSRWR